MTLILSSFFYSCLCHISFPCSLICPSVINTNNKRHWNFFNIMPTFWRKGIILIILIGFIISYPRVFLRYISNTCILCLHHSCTFCCSAFCMVFYFFAYIFMSNYAFPGNSWYNSLSMYHSDVCNYSKVY